MPAACSQGYKPPNCPQLIKAAQDNETQAGVALAMAVKNMNETLTALNKMVADAKQNQVIAQPQCKPSERAMMTAR